MTNKDLYSKILHRHDLNEVEQEFAMSLVKLLAHLNEMDVNREYLRYLAEARHLAGALGLVKKVSAEGGGKDLASMLQSMGPDES